MHAMFDPELCHHTSEGKGIMMVSASKEIRKQKMHTNFSLFILFFPFALFCKSHVYICARKCCVSQAMVVLLVCLMDSWLKQPILVNAPVHACVSCQLFLVVFHKNLVWFSSTHLCLVLRLRNDAKWERHNRCRCVQRKGT